MEALLHRTLPPSSFTFLLRTSISRSLELSAFNTGKDGEAHTGKVVRESPGSGICHSCS